MRHMKFGDFLFPECNDPQRDGTIIDEAVAEARLCDELGMDAIWLAEHHFDGNCAYVDPLTFAAALAVATKRVVAGFRGHSDLALPSCSSGGTAFPARPPEQRAADPWPRPRHVLQHLRISGLRAGCRRGARALRGSRRDYSQGLDRGDVRAPRKVLEPPCADPASASLHQAASGDLPGDIERTLGHRLRAAGPADLAESSNQRDDPPARRYVSARDARRRLQRGGDRAQCRQDLGMAQHLCRRNRRQRRHGWPAGICEHDRAPQALRDQIEREQGIKLSPQLAPGLLGFLCGSPATVAAELAELAEIGIGGALMQFRLGAMPHETAAASIELFMRKVAPEFRVDTRRRLIRGAVPEAIVRPFVIWSAVRGRHNPQIASALVPESSARHSDFQ